MERNAQVAKELAALAGWLRRLRACEPREPAGLDAWVIEVRAFEREANAVPSLPVPHFVWHYLSDADIRLKDAGYAESQYTRLDDIIAELESGRLPRDRGVDIPSWAVLVGVGLLAGAVVWGSCARSVQPESRLVWDEALPT